MFYASNFILRRTLSYLPGFETPTDVPTEWVAQMHQTELTPTALLRNVLKTRVDKLFRVVSAELDAFNDETAAHLFALQVCSLYGNNAVNYDDQPGLRIMLTAENNIFDLQSEGVTWSSGPIVGELHDSVRRNNYSLSINNNVYPIEDALDDYDNVVRGYRATRLFCRDAIAGDTSNSHDAPAVDFLETFLVHSSGWATALAYGRYVDAVSFNQELDSVESIWLRFMDTFTWFCKQVDALPEPS